MKPSDLDPLRARIIQPSAEPQLIPCPGGIGMPVRGVPDEQGVATIIGVITVHVMLSPDGQSGTVCRVCNGFGVVRAEITQIPLFPRRFAASKAAAQSGPAETH